MEQYKCYQTISEQEFSIGSFKTKAKVLRHAKTGAKVALLENNDENKVFYIGFRTPPMDSTGVAHITEHSVLCGSEKFPLKDPFVELVKGSLNTFLNAVTYSDKTVYPIASCNDQDFQNLMDVYLDAVFHPNMYKNRAIFLQEGWHYELDDEGKLTYNGVVYNEMKGAFSNADQIFYRQITTCLYPDTQYAVESGGQPEHIPDLTYEDFLAFHGKFYHPSNSYIYLYGDMNMAEKLEFIDKEYLSKFNALEVDSKIAMQPAFTEQKRCEMEYPIDEGDDEKGKAYLSLNFSVGTSLDPIRYIALAMISKIILDQSGAPLKQALLDAGLGKDVYGIYENGIQQPFFSIVAKDADEAREGEFLEIIESTLKKIVSEGLDKKALTACLNKYEFKYLEADFGRYPKGLMYGLQALDSWLYDDEKPFIHVFANETLAFLRKMVDTDFYEKLIEECLLNNPHRAVLVLKPKAGLLQEREKALDEKLAKIRQGMTEADIERIKADKEALEAYQDREDTQEELDTIPVLRREDLKKEAPKLHNEPMDVDGTEVVFHDIFTNGVAYLNLSFKLDDIPEEYFPYLGLLRNVLFELSTEHFSYGELVKEIDLYAGGVGDDTSIVRMEHEIDQCKLYMLLNAKFLYKNMSKVMEILKEVATTSQYGDEKRLLEILREYCTNTKQAMIADGTLLATAHALAYENKCAAYNEILNRLPLYRLASEIEEHFEEKKKEFTDKLSMLAKMIFRPENLRVDFAADRAQLSALFEEIRKFKESLFTEDVPKGKFVPKLSKKNEGFMVPSQVQYVCRAGNYAKKGLKYDGSLRALKVMMGYEYLWMNVRVRGGAYGCVANFGSTGESFFTSYRDPQLSNTVEVFEGAADFVRNFEADERTMTKYVIGAIGDMDTPMTPSALAGFSKDCYLDGTTEEDLQRERDELLATTPEKIRSLAKYIEAFMEDECFCVVGNTGKIKENEKMFGEIKNLF